MNKVGQIINALIPRDLKPNLDFFYTTKAGWLNLAFMLYVIGFSIFIYQMPQNQGSNQACSMNATLETQLKNMKSQIDQMNSTILQQALRFETPINVMKGNLANQTKVLEEMSAKQNDLQQQVRVIIGRQVQVYNDSAVLQSIQVLNVQLNALRGQYYFDLFRFDNLDRESSELQKKFEQHGNGHQSDGQLQELQDLTNKQKKMEIEIKEAEKSAEEEIDSLNRDIKKVKDLIKDVKKENEEFDSQISKMKQQLRNLELDLGNLGHRQNLTESKINRQSDSQVKPVEKQS